MRTLFLALALPSVALAGPFSGYNALGEMGIGYTDPTGLDSTFIQQIPGSGIVGPGIEAQLIMPWVYGDFSDVDATLTVAVNTSWAGAPFIFNGLRFSLTDPGAPSLAGAYLISTTVPGFTASQINAAGSMVTLNFSGTSSAGTITLGFGDPGPSLTLAGSCPGAGSATFADFTPGGTIAVVRGAGAGSAIIPSGPCAGTALPVSGPRLVTTITADAAGGRTLSPTFPGALCGAPLVAVDMATCDVTPIAYIP
jgi:hypothetical protein